MASEEEEYKMWQSLVQFFIKPKQEAVFTVGKRTMELLKEDYEKHFKDTEINAGAIPKGFAQ